jgi:hypothetical protein
MHEKDFSSLCARSVIWNEPDKNVVNSFRIFSKPDKNAEFVKAFTAHAQKYHTVAGNGVYLKFKQVLMPADFTW